MPNTLNPYVTLDGTCEQAVKFWAEALNAKVEIMRVGDSPMPAPPEARNRVMHATVKTADLTLMASDCMVGHPMGKAGPVALSLNFTSKEEQTRVWERLAAGGTVEMPLGDQFWGRYGALQDRFGIRWMLNYEAPKS